MCEYTIPLIVPQDLDDVKPEEYWKCHDVWTLAKPQILMNANDFLAIGFNELRKLRNNNTNEWHHYTTLAYNSRYQRPKNLELWGGTVALRRSRALAKKR